MTTIFNAKWHGVGALLWFLFGFVVTDLMGRYWIDHFVVIFLIWVFLGWFSPFLLLAFSGIRRGPTANRICGVLALVTAFIALLLFILLPIYFHSTRT